MVKEESIAEGVKAVAVLNGTVQGSTINGTVTLTEILEGLKVDVEVVGVPAGKHGFHIHEVGSCEAEGNAAGGHFNPKSVTHGFFPKDGAEHAHCGDMGNIEVSPDGIGGLSIVLPGITLSGENGVAGRSVILHEKEDDFGQPTGNAGGRIACGVIVMAE
jgi:Cu-Zn family superoxide dismutase